MSRPILKPHHLQNLPTTIAEALSEHFNMRLSGDVHQQAALKIWQGKTLEVAVFHARVHVAQANQSCGFEPLDEVEDESKHEQVASEPTLDFEESPKSRIENLDFQTEATLILMARGTVQIAEDWGVCRRRALQIFKKWISNAEVNRYFKNGREKQGDLFSGVQS